MRIALESNKFLTDNTNDLLLDSNNAIFIKTKTNEKYLQELYNKSNFKKFNITTPDKIKKYINIDTNIIAITGTNGKTTTSSCIYHMLLSLGFRCALLGTRGFFINGEKITDKGLTTPTLLEIYKNLNIAAINSCKYFIMEVSSHAITQDRISGLDFKLKILTNIESDHLDFHKTIEEYIDTKNSFFQDESLKLINKDCKNLAFNAINTYTYAIESNANIKVNAYSIDDNIDAHITFNDFKLKLIENAPLHSGLIGKHNLYNIIASIGAIKLICNDIALEDICKTLDNFNGVEGRCEIINNTPLVIVDFAHTEDGIKNICEAYKKRRIKILFGAGGDRDKIKRPKMGRMAEHYSIKIYLTSDNPRNEDPNSIINDILEGIINKDKVYINPDRNATIIKALNDLKNNEVLLILGKGDETYQIIGNKTLPFDDRKIVKDFYTSINNGNLKSH